MARAHFRSMTPAPDGAPTVGRSARALGVRVPEDTCPDAEGQVRPGSGGLSVSPGSMWNLPNHRRPRGMGRGSTGNRQDYVYSIGEPDLLARALSVRPDPARPDKHAFVEPEIEVALEDFEGELVATRDSWSRAWP